MHCKVDIEKGLIKTIIKNEKRDRIRELNDHTLFIRDSEHSKGTPYRIAESLIKKIDKQYGYPMAHLEQHSDGTAIIIKPHDKVIEQYYNKHIDAFYHGQSINRYGDSVVTSELPSGGLTSATPMPLFESNYGLTQTSRVTTTSGDTFQGFNRGSELMQKYPQAEKMLDDIGAKVNIVAPSELENNGKRIKASFDPWTNTIKATKDATPDTIMHEVLQSLLFKASDTKTEEKFNKSPLGRDITKFVDSLRISELPQSDVVDNVLIAVQEGSVQEGATYGLLNYTFTKALNETVSHHQKVEDNVFTDIAKTTLNGLVVKPNTKLAELINILDKHTSKKGVIQQSSAQIDPEVTKSIQKRIDNLKTIGSDVKLVRGAHGEITFEKDGDPIKYTTNDNKLGFHTPIARKVEENIKKTIDQVLDRYVDSNGELKGTPDPAKDNTLIPESHYQVIDQVISEKLKEYPVGTKFIHDKNIYSDARQKAGRLDFIALKPNGKADLLSFDLISKKDYVLPSKTHTQRDVSPQKQEMMRDHLNQLKGILKTAYDIKDFDQVRSMPIYVDVSKTTPNGKEVIPENMSWDNVHSDQTNRKKIDEVPTWDESTGNKDLDNLIKKLVTLDEIKGGEKYSDSNREAKQAIARAIRAIQLGKGVPVLSNMIESAKKSAETSVTDFEKNMKFKDIDAISLDKMAEQARKLNKSSKELELYSKLHLYYKDMYPDPSTQEKKNLDRLENVCADAAKALSRLNDARREFIQDKVAQKFGVENLLLPEPRVGVGAEYVNNFSNPVTKAQYVFQRMLRNTRSAYEVDIQEDLSKLDNIYKSLQDWRKGKSNSDLLDLIKKKDEHGNRVNELISEFKKEFYVTAKKKSEEISSPDKAIRASALEWFKNNIDQEELKKWAIKPRLKALGKLDPESLFYDSNVAQVHSKYDVETGGIYKMYNAVKYFPKKDIWHSDEFRNLTKDENKPVYELYKFAREVNKRASEIGYIEAEKTSRFLPFIHKSLTEKFILGGSWSLTDTILNNLTVSRTDTDYGAWDRLSNEPIDHLVKYFTNDFGTEKTDENGKKYIDHSNVSDDIVKNLALYAGKVREYEGKTGIEDIVKLLLWAEKNKESLQTNMFGNVVQDAEPFTDNKKNYELLSDFVQNQLYDQHLIKNKYTDSASESFANGFNKMAAKINKVFGKEVIPEEKDEIRFSMMKTLQSMQMLQNLKVLGLNLGASTYRFIGTTIQGWIESGEFYTQKDFFAHELEHAQMKFFKKDADLHIALMKSFWPVDSQKKKEVDALSLSKFTAASLSDHLMSMIEHAHDYVQYVNFGAMMDNAVVIDGKIENARKYIQKQSLKDRYSGTFEERKEIDKQFESKVKALIAEHGLINKATLKDNKLHIEGVDMKSESVAVFKDLIRNTGRKLSGNISPENESKLRMTVLGRQLLMFKNWLPGMAHTRFVGLSHNEGIQGYEWGRLRMCMKLLFNHGYRVIDRMISMYRATDKGIDLMTKLYESKKSQYEKNQQPFNLTKEEFFDLMRKNLAKQAKETTAMLGLMGLVSATMAFAHDHKDDESKGYYAFAARTFNRSYEEINLYYNPVSLNAIINGSLVPTLGLLTDTLKFANSYMDYVEGELLGDEDLVDKSHPAKYGLKSLPILSQVPNYIAIIAPDIAKELGITVNAQQVKH